MRHDPHADYDSFEADAPSDRRRRANSEKATEEPGENPPVERGANQRWLDKHPKGEQ